MCPDNHKNIRRYRSSDKEKQQSQIELDPDNYEDQFDDMLDDSIPEIEIGCLTYSPSHVLKNVDPTAYRCGLNDFVNNYYPFTFNNNSKISFLDLANHTSGMPRLPENLDVSNKLNPYKNYGSTELNEYLKKILKIDNSTLKKYEYSNLGAGLLGHTLGLSQKQPLNKLLEKRISSNTIKISIFKNKRMILSILELKI